MRIRIAASAITLISLSTGISWGQGAPTVAVLAESEADSRLSGLVSTLEARLSQGGAIRLLERAQIEKVLAEQQLSAAGLTQRDSIIKAGQLLRAEAIVLLTGEQESEQTKSQLVRVRVAETAHGLRLWEGYEALESPQVEAAAERIAARVRAAISKISQASGPAVPVGIVDIRRVQLPEKYEPLARVLPGLLSARLGKEPRIIMLERESLGTLLREKQFTEGPESAFWNSAVLIDGYLQPGAGKGIEMTLRLRRATGEELSSLRVPVDPNRLSGAVDEAATHALKGVSEGSLSGRWDPAQEADEFYRQGTLLLMHGRRRAARTCLEAAHALQPDNVAYTGALFSASLPLPKTLNQPAEPADASASTALELAELASLLTRQIRDGYDSGVLSARDRQFDYGPVSQYSYFYFRQAVSVATEEVRLINRSSRRIWFETAEKALIDRATQGGDPVMSADGRIELAWASSDDPDEVMAALRERLNKAILPPAMGGAFTSNDSRCMCCEQELFIYSRMQLDQLDKTNLCGAAERFRTLWNAYVKELAESRDPIVKFFACATQIFELANVRKEEDRELAAAYCRRAVDVLLNELHSPDEPLSDSVKERIRRIMTACLSSPSLGTEEAVSLWEKIFSPLIEAGDARALAVWNPSRQTSIYGGPEAAQRYCSLLTRIDQVYAKNDHDPQINRARTTLRDALREMELVGGHPGPSPGAQGPRVTMLLRRTDWPQEKYTPGSTPFFSTETTYGVPTAIHGDMLWAGFFFPFSSAPTGFSTALVGLDLSRREVKAIWWVALRDPYPLGGLVVRPDRSYLAVPQLGIITLPGSDASGREFVKQPHILTDANGLPSVCVTSIADAGDRLWVGYGGWRPDGAERESGLGLYDPASATWERIFCSAEQGEPPFSAGSLYCLNNLTPAGDRLFFFVTETFWPPEKTCADGLWKMNVATRALTYFGYGGILSRGHVITDGTKRLFADRSSLTEFDLETEKSRLICGGMWWVKEHSELPIKRMESERAGGVEESLNRKFTYGLSALGHVDLSGAAIHKNRVWARLGQSQLVVIPMAGAEGDVITLDNNLLEGGEVVRFVSTPHGLVGIGNGTAGLIETDDSWFTQSERK